MGGTRRSSWLTFRRRLLLVRLLLRGAATKEALIAAVRAELGDEGYPAAAESALKHDLDALKAEYGCVFSFQRRSGCYTLEHLGDLALLDLPDECMEALAFLDASFPQGADLPGHFGVRNLLERLLLLLPASRRREHRKRRRAMSFQIATSIPGQVDPKVLAKVKRAVELRQELEFDYLSSFDEHGPRRHRVAPYGIYFRPEGHGYLDATLLDVIPGGNEPRHAAISYRLSRMVSGSVVILPNVLPPERQQPPSYALRYRLVPVVARRRDVATYFPETRITYHDDGSATVTATATNLWQARQILLRYGTGCQVLEPPELVELFRATARGLNEIYSP
ncbi:MAG: WYL domain-containing protein [Chloroflexaceae bacterium]|nr:WYL domain-containing protein [Chloroflexaceae bacterium]